MKQLLLFVVLFVVSWSQVSAAELNRQLLDDFPGTYEAHAVILYSNPEKELVTQSIYFTFEAPVYANVNRTEAVGRAIQSIKSAAPNVAAGGDGLSPKQENHNIELYAMTWHNLHQEFAVRLIDQDDTSVFSLRYNTDGIVGDGFEIQKFETRTQGASLGVGNSLVATITMKKADSHPFDKIPTYDEVHALITL
jgi:hypothetical protein